MKYVTFYFTACVTLMTATSVVGQDFPERIRALRKTYTSSTKLKAEMLVQVFETKDSAVPLYSDRGIIRRLDENFYSNFSTAEMLMNDKFMLVVDRSTRMIVCAPRDIKNETKFLNSGTFNLDSILSLYDSPKRVMTNDTTELYRLHQKSGVVTLVDLYLTAGQDRVQRIDYQYKNGQYVIIRYLQFDMTPVFASSDFDINNYIVDVGTNNARPASRYQRYSLSMK